MSTGGSGNFGTGAGGKGVGGKGGEYWNFCGQPGHNKAKCRRLDEMMHA